MLLYYQTRIKNKYMPDLDRAFTGFSYRALESDLNNSARSASPHYSGFSLPWLLLRCYVQGSRSPRKVWVKNTISHRDKTFLPVLYQAIFKYMGVSARKLDLNKWQRDDTLPSNIVRVYNESGNFTGAYFPRFLNYQNHFAASTVAKPFNKSVLELFIKKTPTFNDSAG